MNEAAIYENIITIVKQLLFSGSDLPRTNWPSCTCNRKPFGVSECRRLCEKLFPIERRNHEGRSMGQNNCPHDTHTLANIHVRTNRLTLTHNTDVFQG